MSRFTFTRGNLRKLAALPLYAVTAPVRWVVPRSPDRWVVGCGSGIGEGALELYREIEQRFPQHSLVWLVSSAEQHDQATLEGVRTASRDSLRGWWLTMRAGASVVTHGFGDVNRYGVMGSYVIQLWHGIPLKKLHLDSPVTTQLTGMPRPLQRILERLYGKSTRAISFLAVASPLSASRMRSAFRLKAEQLAITGDPRDDVLLRGVAEDRESDARSTIQRSLATDFGDDALVLYAPTWRDGDPDPAIPSEREWAALAALAEDRGIHIIVRSHPLGEGDYAQGIASSPRLHLMGADRVAHVTPVLPAFAAVITDYSSIAYDFSLTGGALIWFAPDLASYERTRGLYESYALVTEGSYVSDWAGVCSQLRDIFSMGDAGKVASEAARERSRRLASRHFSFTDSRSAERVLDEVMTRRAGRVFPNLVSESQPAVPQASPLEIAVLSAAAAPADEPAALIIRGSSASGFVPSRLTLAGSQADRVADVVVHDPADDERIIWQARFALVQQQSEPCLPPPSGRYELIASFGEADGATVRDMPLIWAETNTYAAHEPYVSVGEWCSLSTMPAAHAAVVIDIGPPIDPQELTAEAQARHESAYRSATPRPEPAVFFESFYGRVATCNPAAIDRELARQAPHIIRYWSVKDLSVAIPEGAIPLIEGSPEWWRVRGSARLLVVNDWLRKRWKPRPYQTVLQTWHGTMLKRLALSRPNVGARQAVAIVRESRRWDILLSQNGHSTRDFRRSYRFRGAIWQVGYPRNDAIVVGNAGDARRRLGLPVDSRVVLYAPTWRDASSELVDNVGVERLQRELGDNCIVLVRGHSRTHEFGRYGVAGGTHSGEAARGIVDVSRYPDLDDLILASDVIVTDYSSIMFDASVARKPVVFYVPDIDSYEGTERGFTFDFEVRALGPLTRTLEDLVDAIREPDAWAPEYASRYDAWRRDFNPHDDGQASRRVVSRLLADGLL